MRIRCRQSSAYFATGTRRGFSLVEMLAAMALLMIVMGLVAVLIEILIRLESSGRNHAETEAQLARIARAVRADVRGALDAQIPSDPKSATRLTLSAGDTVVEYRAEDDNLIRMEATGKTLKEQDRFRLPSRSSARFEKREEKGRTFLVLTVDRTARKHEHESIVRPFRVEGWLGADQRFAKEESK